MVCNDDRLSTQISRFSQKEKGNRVIEVTFFLLMNQIGIIERLLVAV